jgi:hypothetical protein
VNVNKVRKGKAWVSMIAAIVLCLGSKGDGKSNLSENSSGTVRVTVEDAARLLGIQNASVRKRIKRGKLASEQDAQGRTFVFLEVDKLVHDGSDLRRSRPAAKPPKVSLADIGAISAVLAAFAAGIYAL